MTTQYTNLLGFALPVTGELNGTWGDVVNDSITELVEDSIAGQATASVTSGDWTLTTTGSGLTNQARCAILIPTGTPGVSRNIIAPSSSKAYIVVNQSNAAVVVKGAATTGTTIVAGGKALVAWNGSDFVQVGNTGTVTSVTVSGGTTGLTASGNPVTSSGTITLAGTLGVANGGTGLTTIAAKSIPVANSADTYTTITPSAGQSVRINAGGTAWEAYTPSSAVGSVTSVSGTGTVNGITLTGTVTSSGNLTLGGTLSGVSLSSQVTGTLPVANGGTGVTSSTGTGAVVLNTSPSLTTPTVTGLKETKDTISASNIDLAAGNYFTKTISGDTTFTVSNVPSTGTAVAFILDLTNGGSATITWWSGVSWVDGIAPTLTALGRDSLGFYTYDGGTTWSGFVLGLNLI